MNKRLNKEIILNSIDQDNGLLENMVETLEKENEKLRFKNKKKEIILKEIQNVVGQMN